MRLIWTERLIWTGHNLAKHMMVMSLRSVVSRVKLLIRISLSSDEAVARVGRLLLDNAWSSGSEHAVMQSTVAGTVDSSPSGSDSTTLDAKDKCESEDEAVDMCSYNIDEAEERKALIADAGRELTARINHSLQNARMKTEEAVISVCDQVARLVDIAKLGNAEAERTLQVIVGAPSQFATDIEKPSIADVIQTQTESVNEFVSHTRQFFSQQIAAANHAIASCREMQMCVAQVVKLVFSSEILAYNIQIESARLGDQGSAFSVLGDEMVRFSSKVRDANIAIQNSLSQVNESMLRFQQESIEMDSRLNNFTEQLHHRMSDVEQHTTSLKSSLHVTLDGITERNQQVIKCSQTALSELQFQDPLAQSLLRAELEVNKLQKLIETGSCDALESDQAHEAIGQGIAHEREPGLVELF